MPTEKELLDVIRSAYISGGSPESMIMSDDTAQRLFGIDPSTIPEDGSAVTLPNGATVQRFPLTNNFDDPMTVYNRAVAYFDEMSRALSSAVTEIGKSRCSREIDYWSDLIKEHTRKVRTLRYILTGSFDEKGD